MNPRDQGGEGNISKPVALLVLLSFPCRAAPPNLL